MARPGWPERNREARSFRQLRRFDHVINLDKVFGTHNPVAPNQSPFVPSRLSIAQVSHVAVRDAHDRWYPVLPVQSPRLENRFLQ